MEDRVGEWIVLGFGDGWGWVEGEEGSERWWWWRVKPLEDFVVFGGIEA